ncbi:hypothetical protein ACJ5M5_004511 [Vibrio alginolyticus]
MAKGLNINTVDITDITLPFKIEPLGEKSDALDDFCIRTTEWVNYISEVLLFCHIGSKMPISDYSVKPQLFAPRNRQRNNSNELPTPKITIKDKNFDSISRNLSRNLFNHSVSQLATNFEIFLNEITEDILWRNVELLANDQKQLSNKEIFDLGDLEDIKDNLIQRKILEHAMSAYPKRVDSFQKLFHIGIHSKKSPVELPIVHDLVEVRNVIQHSDGHCSEQYLQRLSVYKDTSYEQLLKRRYTQPKIDFQWLLQLGIDMVGLAEFIDAEADQKWTTTRNCE